MLNIILFAVLWKASGGNKPSQSARRDNAFRNAVIVASIIMLLVVVADVAFAVKTGMDGQDVICAVASIGRRVYVHCSFPSYPYLAYRIRMYLGTNFLWLVFSLCSPLVQTISSYRCSAENRSIVMSSNLPGLARRACQGLLKHPLHMKQQLELANENVYYLD